MESLKIISSESSTKLEQNHYPYAKLHLRLPLHRDKKIFLLNAKYNLKNALKFGHKQRFLSYAAVQIDHFRSDFSHCCHRESRYLRSEKAFFIYDTRKLVSRATTAARTKSISHSKIVNTLNMIVILFDN
jgi:hypothetical protein